MSSFNTPWFSDQGNTFFQHLDVAKPRHVFITGETQDFASEVIAAWSAAGFETRYIAMDEDEEKYVCRLRDIGNELGVGDIYAIVAFADAASIVLQAFIKHRSPRLVAIIAYYPSAIPDPATKYSPSCKVLVHLAGKEVDVKRHPQVLGIQSNKVKTVRKRIDSGVGFGGFLKLGFRAYSYKDCDSGFAEHDLDEYDGLAEQLAFSRSVAVVKRAFKIDEDIEATRDDFVDAAVQRDSKSTTHLVDRAVSLINVPTLTGGHGSSELENYFGKSVHPLPASLTHRLISRTSDTERVVDEILLRFKHTQMMPWILPNIPPTNKNVEIAFVSISRVQAGLLHSEHVYWDQASVLLQVGLLDPKLVPQHWRSKVSRLPVVGAEAARAVYDGGTMSSSK